MEPTVIEMVYSQWESLVGVLGGNNGLLLEVASRLERLEVLLLSVVVCGLGIFVWEEYHRVD